VRRGLNLKRVGHTGTLDPLATGILIVCLGHATRLSEYAMNSTKRYLARVRLGITTTTYDAEGDITRQTDASHITPDQFEAVLPRFLGEIDQLPPLYSAIKKGGKKLYELARAGKGDNIELEPRRVTIETLMVHDAQLGGTQAEFTLEVTCSAGTYIRSLAVDIGEALGVGAHLSALRRTASGQFSLDNAVSLERVLAASGEGDSWRQYILPPEIVMQGWQVVTLSPQAYNDIRQGRPIPAHDTPLEGDAASSIARAVAIDGRTAAILRRDGDLWKPHKVFI
jgi:tRNA pseudouridine55 synthase